MAIEFIIQELLEYLCSILGGCEWVDVAGGWVWLCVDVDVHEGKRKRKPSSHPPTHPFLISVNVLSNQQISLYKQVFLVKLI